ncbi:MAG: rhodanese-related sulfurtransferase [Sulfurimonas sp.]|jgi:rhodanese-related sulfurtransferase
MKLSKIILALLIFVSFLQAEVKNENTVLKLWKKQVSIARAEVKSITPKELMSWIKNKKDFILVDIREKKEVSSGWIESKTTKKISRGTLDPAVAKAGALKPEQTIVLYCHKGPRAVLAIKTLEDLGFKNVYNLKGGIDAWMNAGYPIVNSMGTFKSVPYETTGRE